MSKVKEQLADNITGHWDFRQGHINDISGSGGDGTFAGGVSWQKSTKGNVLQFDSSSGYIDCGSSVLSGATSFSVAAWFKTPSPDSTITVVSKDDRTTGVTKRLFQIQCISSNFYAYVWDDSSGGWTGKQKGSAVSSDEWHHVVFTYDGSTTTTLYLDNSELTTAYTGGSFTASDDTTGDFLIGAHIGAGGTKERFWDGNIREVIVFDTVLTSEQAANLYSESTLEAHSDFYPSRTRLLDSSYTESSTRYISYNLNSTTVYDRSGNGNVGSASGAIISEGLFGKALNFTGASGAVDAGSDASIGNAFDGGGTISMWVHPRGIGGGSLGRLLDKDQWHLRLNSESGGFCKLLFTCSWAGGPDMTTQTTSREIAYNAWHHVVVKYDSDAYTNRVKIYINGDEVAVTDSATPDNGTTRSDDSASTLYIGNSADGTRGFDGQIDCFEIYDGELTDGEIANLYGRAENKLSISDIKPPILSTVSNVSGGPINGSELFVSSGTFKVEYDGDEKYIECVSAGRMVIDSTYLFGTWEFDIYWGNTANNLNVIFAAQADAAPTDASQNGYEYALRRLTGVNIHLFYEISSGTETQLIGTNSGLPEAGEWISIGMCRLTNGDTCIVVDGEEGVPENDLTHTTSSYIVIDMDAGDRIKNLIYKPIYV